MARASVRAGGQHFNLACSALPQPSAHVSVEVAPGSASLVGPLAQPATRNVQPLTRRGVSLRDTSCSIQLAP